MTQKVHHRQEKKPTGQCSSTAHLDDVTGFSGFNVTGFSGFSVTGFSVGATSLNDV